MGTFVNHSLVAREALRHLDNNTVMAGKVFRGYESEWEKRPNDIDIGAALTIKAPVYFRVKTGATLDTVELKERSTTFTINQRKQVSWPVTSQEMTLNIDKFSKRFIKPAMQALANHIDLSLLGLYTGIPNQVGTPGTTPNNTLTFGLAAARLDEEACPSDDRCCLIDPQAQALMADTLKGLFLPAVVGKAVKKNQLPSLAGFDMFMSQNVNTHTCGTQAGTEGAVKSGASSNADTTIAYEGGLDAGTFLEGDIYTIDSVNSVNPISGQSTGQLRQIAVGADVTSTTGQGTLTGTPGTSPYQFYDSTADEDDLPYQNIDTLPANEAPITVTGSPGLQHKVNLAFHKDCLGLAMVPLAMPASVVWKAQESYNGYTIRVIRDYDVTDDLEYIRFDCLYGIKVLNPLLGCRIAGG